MGMEGKQTEGMALMGAAASQVIVWQGLYTGTKETASGGWIFSL